MTKGQYTTKGLIDNEKALIDSNEKALIDSTQGPRTGASHGRITCVPMRTHVESNTLESNTLNKLQQARYPSLSLKTSENQQRILTERILTDLYHPVPLHQTSTKQFHVVNGSMWSMYTAHTRLITRYCAAAHKILRSSYSMYSM
ncbi:hypothetical protein AB6D20_027725 (plasmid) [Vibrio splendidus]